VQKGQREGPRQRGVARHFQPREAAALHEGAYGEAAGERVVGEREHAEVGPRGDEKGGQRAREKVARHLGGRRRTHKRERKRGRKKKERE
jgi:hypothetical protein